MAVEVQYVVLDLETTGLLSDQNGIVEICALSFLLKDFKDTNFYNNLVTPFEDDLFDENFDSFSKIKREEIYSKGIKPEVMYKSLKEFFISLKSKKTDRYKPILVGHNICFDISFLSVFFRKFKDNLFNYVSENSIDTLMLARMRWDYQLKEGEDQSYKLGSCLKRIGYDLVDAHRASNDVIATKQLFRYFVESMRNNVNFQVEKEEKEYFYQF